MKNHNLEKRKLFPESNISFVPFVGTKNKKFRHLSKLSVEILSSYGDSISCVKRHTKNFSLFFSGGLDGNIKAWVFGEKNQNISIRSHLHSVKDLAIDCDGLVLISCSEDYFIKAWALSQTSINLKGYFKHNLVANSLSSHPSGHFFVSGGKEILLWDLTKFRPVQKLFHELVSVSKVSFNPLEHNFVSSCALNNSIMFSDLRVHALVAKILLKMPSNDMSWNHINSCQIAVGNEDGNLYFFDTRNLSKFFGKLKSCSTPIINVDHSPKSNSIVVNSSSGKLKLFNTKRISSNGIFIDCVKKIYNVCFSLDGQSVIAGSDDGDLCIWKKI